MIKKVLIINFNFPPSPSIGGRRWSYFGRSLYEKGVDVHVITSDYNDLDKGKCPWGETIKPFKDNIHYLAHKTPYHIMNMSPDSILGKLKYRQSLKKANRVYDANPFDRTLYFAKDAIKKAFELISELDIQNVIVTGGPFHLLYEARNLKREHPKLNLIIDLRDPWTEKYGETVKDENLKLERTRQRKLNEFVDRVYVPVDPMISQLEDLWPNLGSKIKLLPHGFDQSIYKKERMEIKKDYAKWYYAGSLYPEMDKEVKILTEVSNELLANISIFTYSESDIYPSLTQSHITFNKVMEQDKFFDLTKDFGVALILLPYQFKDFKSSKFIELVKRGVYILYIGHHGIVSDFILEHNIGCFIDCNREVSPELIEDIKKGILEFQPKRELAKNYSFDYLSEQIIRDLK